MKKQRWKSDNITKIFSKHFHIVTIKTEYTPQIKDVQNRRKLTARLTTQMIKHPHAGKFPACPLAFQIA